MKKGIAIVIIAISSVFLLTACLGVGETDANQDSNVQNEIADDRDLDKDLISSNESEEDYGAKGALTSGEFTLEDMLKYAIQDECLARQEYESIMEEYGEQRPFSNIIKAEVTHIAMLEELYNDYNLVIPKDTAIDYIVIPERLDLAYDIGVQAEIGNIAMYDMFLEQNLPDDVRDVFIELRDASKNHLSAFEKGPRGRGNG